MLIENAPANVIGGQIPDSGNVIAGNTLDGVVIENYVDGTVPSIIQPAPIVVDAPAASGTANDVQGNSIGFNDRNGLIYPIPNRDGVDICVVREPGRRRFARRRRTSSSSTTATA